MTTDCGHTCCAIRSNSYHRHTMAPERCDPCAAAAPATDPGGDGDEQRTDPREAPSAGPQSVVR